MTDRRISGSSVVIVWKSGNVENEDTPQISVFVLVSDLAIT